MRTPLPVVPSANLAPTQPILYCSSSPAANEAGFPGLLECEVSKTSEILPVQLAVPDFVMYHLAKIPADKLLRFRRELLKQRDRIRSGGCQERLGGSDDPGCRLSGESTSLEGLGNEDERLACLGNDRRMLPTEVHVSQGFRNT